MNDVNLLEALFGTVPGGLSYGAFELIKASAVREGSGAPRGQEGTVVSRSDGALEVTFAAGCTLRLERLDREARFPHFRAAITECSVEESFVVLLRLGLDNRTKPYFMIPGLLYGTNNAHRITAEPPDCGFDAKLDYRSGRVTQEACGSPEWHFRADHSGTPSVVAVHDDRVTAIGIKEVCVQTDGSWVYNSFGLWTDAKRGDSITVALGTLDWPARIICHTLGDAPVLEAIAPEDAVGLSTEICLCAESAPDRFAYEPFLEAWYDHLHEAPREGPPAREAMGDVAEALITGGVDPETGYFHMYRTPEGIQREASTLLAWAGILQIARPLLAAGRCLESSGIVKTVSDMVDRVLVEAINEQSGFYCDSFLADQGWIPSAWRPELGHSALINGHASYCLLKMVEEGDVPDAWADAAYRILDHALPHQRDDGRFPGGFSPEDGSPLTFDTFGGCFLTAPLFIRHRLSGDARSFEAGLRALEHYWEEFTRLEWVGVDLDCNGAVDSGSSYSLARALTEHHRLTGDSVSLDRLAHVIHYGLSYHFSYDTRHRNPVCPWSSCGAKVTSTHNCHLDVHAGELLDNIVYYLAERENPYFARRMEDTLAWARQAYNRFDAEYSWGEKGWLVEQLYHTYDQYHAEVGDGTVWEGYFPWAAGSLLATFLVDVQQNGGRV
jgi:hypothetical protein